MKGKQVHVNKTFVLQAVWLIFLFIVAEGQQGAAFHRCDNEQSYRFRDFVENSEVGFKAKTYHRDGKRCSQFAQQEISQPKASLEKCKDGICVFV